MKTHHKTSEKHLKQQKKEKHVSKKPKSHADPQADDHLQQIPQRLREIIKSKEKMNLSSRQRKKAHKAQMQTAQGDIPVPHFRRGKRESEKAYLRRMNQESQHVLFLTNNQVERQPELEKKEEEKPEEKKSTKKRGLSKPKLLQLQKKLNQREKREEKEMFTDEVAFGEVAMAPPSLSVKPKKATVKAQGAPKGLLLTSLLGHSTVSGHKPSMARKRIMEEERERVVQLYRQMKKQQQEKHEQKRAGKTSR